MYHNVILWPLLTAALTLPATSASATSPLDVVKEGRRAARESNLDQAGITKPLTSGSNIVIIAAACLGIAMAASGLLAVYRGSAADNDQQVRAGWTMVVIGSLTTIPATVAAIVPYLARFF